MACSLNEEKRKSKGIQKTELRVPREQVSHSQTTPHRHTPSKTQYILWTLAIEALKPAQTEVTVWHMDLLAVTPPAVLWVDVLVVDSKIFVATWYALYPLCFLVVFTF